MRWRRIHGGRGRFSDRPQTLSGGVTLGIRRALVPGVITGTHTRTHLESSCVRILLYSLVPVHTGYIS
jgi:hypothetical protein